MYYFIGEKYVFLLIYTVYCAQKLLAGSVRVEADPIDSITFIFDHAGHK